jgi:dipeptidyl aminopeptidase/acylaminoacyl peptidase
VTERTEAPYGSWASPISAVTLAESAVRLGAVRWSGDALYWIEARPTEGGRNVLVRRDPSSRVDDLIPPGFNARTRVHEYGGGSFALGGETAVFSNFSDQRLYRQDGLGAEPHPITPEPGVPAGLRYADGRFTPDGRHLICVRERHEGGEVTNELVGLPLDGGAEFRILASGRDFYSSPRISPDGRRLAWTEWDHPNMPWDGTELWVGELTPDGEMAGQPDWVSGGSTESVFQPEWSPDGILHFVSDRTGWWNLYRVQAGEAQPLYPMEAEFGVPQWMFGQSRYAFLPDGRIACLFVRDGIDHLALLDPAGSDLKTLDLPFTTFSSLDSSGGRLAFVAAGPRQPQAVVVLDPISGDLETVRLSHDLQVERDYISMPRPLSFPTVGGLFAHALYYSPANPEFTGPMGERPPLLVLSHGGPTSQATSELDLETQFFTSRGFAVVDVNYGGSTGYGRSYRERLKGRWGIVDLHDCVNAARFLADRGEVDGRRMAIRGGSAGGYTTLSALAFSDVFAAGASYYGVADLATLARDTHKFESRYLDGLVGPYPEYADRYRERSPIHAADRLSCPVILFQGLEDEVVPPAQAEVMVRALQEKGIPFAYLAFEGEQHGFRRAETIRRCAEAELSFYGQIFGFIPAGQIESVAVDNL